MREYSRSLLRYFLSQGFIFLVMTAPITAAAIETTHNGETVSWNINGIDNITFQSCSDDPGPGYGCHYVASMPSPGTDVTISASITPNKWTTLPYGSNWLQIYNIPAGTSMTDRCDKISGKCVPGYSLNLSGSTKVVNDVAIAPYSFMDAFMIVFSGTSGTSTVEIKLHLFNNNPFTIDARPDLLGGPEDNNCVKFTDGSNRPRWVKYKGSGPGL